jgi:hypothetical protein
LVAKSFSFESKAIEYRLNITLSLENRGFASPYINSTVSFVLKNKNSSYEFDQNDIDMRRFMPEKTTDIETSIDTLGIEKVK